MTRTFGVDGMAAPEGWAMVDDRLMREWAFPNFHDAKVFVDQISQLANEHNHHPEIHFGWGYVVIELMTHDQGSVTELDLDLARAINQLEG